MSQNPDSQFRDLHRVLFNYISDAVFVYQREEDGDASNFIDVNDVACKMMGYSREEFLNMGPMDIADPDHDIDYNELGKRLFDENHVLFESNHIAKDGKKIPVEINTHLFGYKGKPTAVSIIRDITERKKQEEDRERTQEELERRVVDRTADFEYANVRLRMEIEQHQLAQKENLRLYSAMQQTSDGIAITDIDGIIQFVNRSYAQMHGYTPQEMIGMELKKINKRIISGSYQGHSARDILKTQATDTLDVEHYRKDGSFFPAMVSLSYIEDENNKPTGVISVARDITERKKAEGEILRLNSAIEQASDGIAIFTKSDRIISYINTAYANMLGYTPDELIGKAYRKLNSKLISNEYETLADILNASASTIQPMEIEHIRKDGSLFPVLVSFTYLKYEEDEYTEVVVVAKDVTERKKTETDMLRLNSAMRQAHDGIAIFNRDTGYISYANSSYEQMLGYGPQELLNMHIRHLMNRTTGDQYPSLSDVLDDKRPVKENVDVEHIRKDGSVFPAILSLAYIFDDNGKPTADVLIVTRDVTESKKAEADILRLNAAMKQASDGIAIFSQSDGAITYANNAFIEALGYTHQEIIGVHIRHTLEKVISDKFETLGAVLDLHKTTAQTLEVEHLRKDGSIFPALLSIVYLINVAGEATDNVVVVSSDITQIKQAEEAMKESEEKYRSSFEKARDAINVFTPDRAFVDANKKFLELCGYSKDELLKLHLFDIYPEAATEASKQRVVDAAQGKEVRVFESVLARKDGTTVPVEIAFSALRNTYGQDIVFQGNIRDITERKQMEAKIRQTNQELEKANVDLLEADKLKSIFLASMSHELRTPLNSIIGFTSLILQGLTGEINKEQHSQLSIVKSSATHLLSLINDVLDLSKLEAGRVDLMLDKFKLDDMLRESLGTFAPMVEMKGIQLNSDYPENITLNNDVRRMKQIVINLVSNAVKFTDSGNVELVASVTNSTLQIKVKDTGLGMKEEDMRRLFQPFQQINEQLVKNREGTGLGLYLSRKLANLMGGEITADSEYGKGSVFTFTTPIDIEKAKGSSND